MKTVIFLIFMGLLIFGMIWATRRSQAKATLEKHHALERRKKERKETLKQDYVTWPVIIRPVTGAAAPDTESEADDHARELAMSSIEFETHEQKSA